jgi:hypothetical protein
MLGIAQKPKKKAAKRSSKQKLTLERVIGCTTNSTVGACVSAQGDVAYLSGCIVILYNPKKNKQTKFFFSKNNKTLSSVAFSKDGKLLAAGETGHNPR